MFKLQNNIPEVYTHESRDFQLLCRLYDVVNNGVRFDISTILNILDASKCQDSILDLLALRKGFEPTQTFDTDSYRILLNGFPYICKYKGSKLGILKAIALVLRLDNLLEDAQVTISSGDSNIIIETKYPIKNKVILKELLTYVLPIGMTYSLKILSKTSKTQASSIKSVDTVSLRKYYSTWKNSEIPNSQSDLSSIYNNSILSSEIIDSKILTNTNKIDDNIVNSYYIDGNKLVEGEIDGN